MPRSCVIFDFDGVIADTERLHLATYNAAFAQFSDELGGPLVIPPEIYFSRYIVYGNREGFTLILKDANRPADDRLIDRLCAAKDKAFEEHLHHATEPLPGIRPTLAWLEQHRIPRAICSGAGKKEIVHQLGRFNLLAHFPIIVSIEDVSRGKPDPEGYNLAFALLNRAVNGTLEKAHSLVIEDSAGGCQAARAAGLRVLGVATSLPLEKLALCADLAIQDLTKLPPEGLADLLHLNT